MLKMLPVRIYVCIFNYMYYLNVVLPLIILDCSPGYHLKKLYPRILGGIEILCSIKIEDEINDFYLNCSFACYDFIKAIA